MIRKLAPYTRGYRIWIVLGVLCSAGEAVLELLLPKLMSNIVDVGIAGGDRAYILATGTKMVLMALCSLALGIARRRFPRARAWASARICVWPNIRRCRSSFVFPTSSTSRPPRSSRA